MAESKVVDEVGALSSLACARASKDVDDGDLGVVEGGCRGSVIDCDGHVSWSLPCDGEVREGGQLVWDSLKQD